MSKSKTVAHDICPCGKRAFVDRQSADKAMGRAQTKRRRAADSRGTRRGSKIEGRIYLCPESEMYHLTSLSRSEYESRTLVSA